MYQPFLQSHRLIRQQGVKSPGNDTIYYLSPKKFKYVMGNQF